MIEPMMVTREPLTWDKTGERIYQTGVDRGVLYLQDGRAIAWNGLTSVEDGSTYELKSFYLDGVKYLDSLLPGDFSGKLKAFTYPDEFEECVGIADVGQGLSYHDQPPKSFNLSYRTKIGNDLAGIDFAYKLHLLYNLVANPDNFVFDSLQGSPKPVEFSWSLTGTPPKIRGRRPTVHISIDSRNTDPDTLAVIENVLYGTTSSDPRFPPITEVAGYFGLLDALLIIDNGDGTWTAVDNSNQYITMTDDTTFQIDNADVVIVDPSTYRISSTNT